MQTDLHITVAAAPDGGVRLERDLRLTKAALLYADRVTLCSFTSNLVLGALAVGDLKHEDRVDFIAAVAPALSAYSTAGFATLRETYRRLRRSRRKTRDQFRQLALIERTMDKAWDELRPVLRRIADDSGADELVRAVDSGLVTLQTFRNYDDQKMEFVGFLRATLTDRQNYPLLDEQIGQLVRTATAEGAIPVSRAGIGRGRHAALAADLLARLPLFDRASFDEVVDIRRELEGPLVRFRAAIQKFSETIESAPWDTDFAGETEVVFIRDVAPAIAEIEDAIASNVCLQKIVDGVVQSGAKVGAFGVVIANAAGAPEIVQAATGLTPVASAAWDAFRRWQDENEAIARNQMFFYYRAEERLAE